MDRIRQLWIESSRSSSFEGVSVVCVNHHQHNNNRNNHQYNHHHNNSRPPPLRTSSTYDDDELFNNVAINMLSRYENLGLTIGETIVSVLPNTKQRISFLDGLRWRIERSDHLSPKTLSLVGTLERIFGAKLRSMVIAECTSTTNGSGVGHQHELCYTMKPITPRNTAGSTGGNSTGSSVGSSNGGVPVSTMAAATTTTMAATTTTANHHRTKKTRRFFSDCDKVFFRKRRVQNIDWKLAEAVQQVESLQLDGSSPPSNTSCCGYEPPRGI